MDRANSECLTDEQVSELVEGLASPEEAELFTSHIAECAQCATLAAAVRSARTLSRPPLPGESPIAAFVPLVDDVLARGARVGRYEILERIGAGGMGTVYAAHDPALDRKIALKLIRAQLAGPELEVRLLREAKAMARLSHPEVIAVHDAGRDGDRLFIAMELIDGGTLREWQKQQPRSWQEIVAVYVRAGQGLAQAHASGLVHRDFKPDNVLIGKDGRVRVTDFGLARDADAEDRESDEAPPPGSEPVSLELASTMYAPLTRTGALLGTPVYMAPEQLSGIPADARSDIYAFCVALYEALYGERPFGGTTLIAQKEEKDAGVIRAAPPGRSVPARVRRVLAVGLRPRPADRYASIGELLGALDRAVRWPRRAGAWAGAALGVLAVGGAVTWSRGHKPAGGAVNVGPDSVKIAVAALAGPDARLACPIFETRGVPDVGVRLGAAAATLACLRTRWELGGNPDRVLLPASLLDLPNQPVDSLPDPYVAPEQRAHTVAIAKARAAAYIDGTVAHDRESWVVDLVVRAPDDREIARGQGADAGFLPAVRHALEGLWRAPLVRREIDPDVARWTSFPDVEMGLLETDMLRLEFTAGCVGLASRAHRMGNALFYLQKECESAGFTATPDAGVPRLDESSPEALVTSVPALQEWGISIPVEDERRVAGKLESLRGDEKSSFGRARLALTAGLLWSLANDRERARASLLLSLREDPLISDTWDLIIGASSAGTFADSAVSVASAWLPNLARYVVKAGSWRGDELDARVRDGRLAYLLRPTLPHAMHLGRALAEAGRADEARALAATPLDTADSNRVLNSYVEGFIDLHDAKIARAIPHLEDSGDVAMIDLVVAADVAGRADEVATRWATRFLSLPDDQVDITARGYDSPMVLCMRARGGLAKRCLDRVERLGHAAINWWYEGGTALLEGSRRYAAGDIHGAVSVWRPLVAAPDPEIIRLLPTEAFERAGEPDLAARLDAGKMPFTSIAGISDAAPREAKRALAAGDAARARELARAVVQAWEVADIEIPAVARMRALLKTVDR